MWPKGSSPLPPFAIVSGVCGDGEGISRRFAAGKWAPQGVGLFLKQFVCPTEKQGCLTLSFFLENAKSSLRYIIPVLVRHRSPTARGARLRRSVASLAETAIPQAIERWSLKSVLPVVVASVRSI